MSLEFRALGFELSERGQGFVGVLSNNFSDWGFPKIRGTFLGGLYNKNI